ncbi:MAG: GDP-mannose 4,6-dehydratase [Limnohabitans sp.]
MKILLTGAAGFTGLFFKSAADAAGHQVVSLQSDLTDKAAVAAEVLQTAPDAVVHLAAISFVGHAQDTAFYDVNVVGTTNLLAGLAASPVKPAKVLLASSASVYGNCDASPISEEQPAAPVNHYAMSKLAMEHMARTYLDSLPIVFTRPFNYTGPGQAPHFLIPKLVSHFARRSEQIELGNLHVEREFNDVRMVCDAYLKLLDKGVTGHAYNVCSGQPYTLHHVIGLLSDITGHKMDVLVNPAFVRANEVHRLCGDPSKLVACTGKLAKFNLGDTLNWMLETQTSV